MKKINNNIIAKISQDSNSQPLVFIRFNPDEYYDENQTKKGLLSIDDNSNLSHRLEKL